MLDNMVSVATLRRRYKFGVIFLIILLLAVLQPSSISIGETDLEGEYSSGILVPGDLNSEGIQPISYGSRVMLYSPDSIEVVGKFTPEITAPPVKMVWLNSDVLAVVTNTYDLPFLFYMYNVSSLINGRSEVVEAIPVDTEAYMQFKKSHIGVQDEVLHIISSHGVHRAYDVNGNKVASSTFPLSTSSFNQYFLSGNGKYIVASGYDGNIAVSQIDGSNQQIVHDSSNIDFEDKNAILVTDEMLYLVDNDATTLILYHFNFITFTFDSWETNEDNILQIILYSSYYERASTSLYTLVGDEKRNNKGTFTLYSFDLDDKEIETKTISTKVDLDQERWKLLYYDEVEDYVIVEENRIFRINTTTPQLTFNLFIKNIYALRIILILLMIGIMIFQLYSLQHVEDQQYVEHEE